MKKIKNQFPSHLISKSNFKKQWDYNFELCNKSIHVLQHTVVKGDLFSKFNSVF